MKSGLKVERRREKKGKIKRKKLQKIFCLRTSTWREEMPLIKVAYFMLNFLNLKSFLRHLFFWVASCLSTLWTLWSAVSFPVEVEKILRKNSTLFVFGKIPRCELRRFLGRTHAPCTSRFRCAPPI